MQKRTMAQWFEYLDDPSRKLTLDEFAAMMAYHTREYTKVMMDRTAAPAADEPRGFLGAMLKKRPA